MKVANFHLPPNTYVRRNSSVYPSEISGPDAVIAKVLRKKINFILLEVPSQEERLVNLHCNYESKRTGFSYLLGNKTIRYINNLSTA